LLPHRRRTLESRTYSVGSSIITSVHEADKLAVEAWNARMLGYKGPAQLSPTLGGVLRRIGTIKDIAILVQLESI
jgi:hypothetical protein